MARFLDYARKGENASDDELASSRLSYATFLTVNAVLLSVSLMLLHVDLDRSSEKWNAIIVGIPLTFMQVIFGLLPAYFFFGLHRRSNAGLAWLILTVSVATTIVLLLGILLSQTVGPPPRNR